MADSSNPKFDLKIVRKLPAPKRPAPSPKREVPSRDIILTRLKSAAEPAKAKSRAPAGQAPQRGGGLLQPLAAFLALLLAAAGLLQVLAFAGEAKQASGRVLGSATSAYGEFDAADQSLKLQDFEAAHARFEAAKSDLDAAQSELDKLKALTLLAEPAKSAQHALSGAYYLAAAGESLTQAMRLLDELKIDREGLDQPGFISRLSENHKLLKHSLILLAYAEESFAQADKLPAEYQATLDRAKQRLATMQGLLNQLAGLQELFLSFFGPDPKTYLLIFQNYDELRATGGFIGTYGSLKYENGKIKRLKIESVYNLDGSLSKRIAAPGPFQPEIAKWGLRDANWFADFPTTAKKLLQFYEMESETADGLIAMTPELFIDLLGLVGDIPMPEYGVTLTAQNFQDTVQLKTSVEYDRELNQPKKFLSDFAPVLLDRLAGLTQDQWFSLFQILVDNFQEKQLLLYHGDPGVQETVLRLGYGGEIKEAVHDYLAVFSSNHGGTKNDLEIDQTTTYESVISEDGRIRNRVVIARANHSGQTNRSFLRVLVPRHSRLLSAEGFADQPQSNAWPEGYLQDPELAAWEQMEKIGNAAVRQEAGKTEFSGWIIAPAEQTAEVAIEYELPFSAKPDLLQPRLAYSLFYQKQPGTKKAALQGKISAESATLSAAAGKAEILSPRQASFASDGQTDGLWGFVISK